MNAEDWFSNSDDIIRRTTSVEDVVGALVGHGCPDLTSAIALARCSTLPLDGGGFCDVYRGSMIHGGQIAIKSLRLYDRPGKENEKEKILKRAARELYYWSKLKHCNVMPLVGLAMFRGQLSMISEWMENGNLRFYVIRNPSVDRIRLCLDVCDGLSYLHANDLVHGDLEAANVMVSHEGIAMIADFGNSQLKDLTLKFTGTTTSNLTIRWAAPELLQGETAAQLTKQADVYAYGMTALEILTGEVPFEEYSDQQVLVLVLIEHKTPDRPELGVSDEQWGILQDCWERDRSQRPNIQDVGKRLATQSCKPSVGDMTRTLRECECPDLTSSIDLAACSDLPPLGRTYLEVYPGRTHQGTQIAIKVVRLYGRLGEEKGKETVFKRLARELYCFSEMKHPNILSLMGLVMFRGDVSTISEWMENGDLKSYISRNPNIDRVSLCVDICMGLSYAHENKLVHGNLKAANVVVSSSGTAMIGDFWDSRIGDLGFKTQFTQSVNQSASARWVAPELMLGEDDPHPSKKSDVYAYGMTVLEILTGQVPFEGLNERRVLKAVVFQHQTPARPVMGVSDEVWEILQGCWTWEPFERPEIEMVLQQLHCLPIPHSLTSKEAERPRP